MRNLINKIIGNPTVTLFFSFQIRFRFPYNSQADVLESENSLKNNVLLLLPDVDGNDDDDNDNNIIKEDNCLLLGRILHLTSLEEIYADFQHTTFYQIMWG